MQNQVNINELTTEQLMVMVYKESRILNSISKNIEILNQEIQKREMAESEAKAVEKPITQE